MIAIISVILCAGFLFIYFKFTEGFDLPDLVFCSFLGGVGGLSIALAITAFIDYNYSKEVNTEHILPFNDKAIIGRDDKSYYICYQECDSQSLTIVEKEYCKIVLCKDSNYFEEIHYNRIKDSKSFWLFVEKRKSPEFVIHLKDTTKILPVAIKE